MEAATVKKLPRKTTSRWVALDLKDNVIAEGSRPDEVRVEAMKKTDKFIIAFVPVKDATYVL
jgi:hypothetical protein